MIRRPRGWGDENTAPSLAVGTATPDGAASEPEHSTLAAMLYVPDPDAWHGWRLHRVERVTATAPRRPAGFGRPA